MTSQHHDNRFIAQLEINNGGKTSFWKYEVSGSHWGISWTVLFPFQFRYLYSELQVQNPIGSCLQTASRKSTRSNAAINNRGEVLDLDMGIKNEFQSILKFTTKLYPTTERKKKDAEQEEIEAGWNEEVQPFFRSNLCKGSIFTEDHNYFPATKIFFWKAPIQFEMQEAKPTHLEGQDWMKCCVAIILNRYSTGGLIKGRCRCICPNFNICFSEINIVYTP